MTTRTTTPERWNDEEVSALLAIYSKDGMQQLLQKAVPNSKCFERCSQKLLEMGIVHSAHGCRIKIKKLRQDYKKIKDHNNKSGNYRKTSKWYERLDDLLGQRPSFSGTTATIDSGTLPWELAETADSVGCEVSNDDNDEGEAGQLAGLETSGLSFPDCNSSRCSSPFPSTKRKRKRAQDTRDENFFVTIETMEDRRAMASKAMHEDQMMLLHKAQETEDRLIAMMERQDERDAVLAQLMGQQMELQKTFQQGFLGVLSELVKSNRPSSL
ncbi:zinc finger and SCAN domain-containing protein 32-like [Pseudochaenichthys georgianus]|uniref:zinc finger and SCAN domain-containing protein 32-like n=1 Tax=Pseudochaenichthys georgianus TaxID=52239 RepID=UPI0039C3DCD4